MQSLGLTSSTTAGLKGVCQYILDDNGVGYCLDSVAVDSHSAWVLWQQYRGVVLSPIDHQLFQLQQQLAALPSSPEYDAERRRINAEMWSLHIQYPAHAVP
jgi:hypothetical protein